MQCARGVPTRATIQPHFTFPFDRGRFRTISRSVNLIELLFVTATSWRRRRGRVPGAD